MSEGRFCVSDFGKRTRAGGLGCGRIVYGISPSPFQVRSRVGSVWGISPRPSRAFGKISRNAGGRGNAFEKIRRGGRRARVRPRGGAAGIQADRRRPQKSESGTGSDRVPKKRRMRTTSGKKRISSRTENIIGNGSSLRDKRPSASKV